MTSESDRHQVDIETELTLLQQRLQNKTQNIMRVIQFNIISLSIIAGFIQFGQLSNVEWDILTTLGVMIVAISILLAVTGMALSGATLTLMRTRNATRTRVKEGIQEYRIRNRYLGWIAVGAIATGGFGIGTMLFGVFRGTAIQPIFPWWAGEAIAFVVLFGGSLLGYGVARRIKTNIPEKD